MNRNFLSKSILSILVFGFAGYASQASAHAYYTSTSNAGDVSLTATNLGTIGSAAASFSSNPGGRSFFDISASVGRWDSDNVTDAHQDLTLSDSDDANLGWTHNSRWARFQVGADNTKVKLSIDGGNSVFHPGFVLFKMTADTNNLNADPNGTSYVPDHLYIQDKSAKGLGTDWQSADSKLKFRLTSSGYDSDLNAGGTFLLHDDLKDIALSDGNQGYLEKIVTLAAGTYFFGVGAAAEWSGATQVLAADRTFTASVQAVPVPGAVWLFGSAIAGLIGFNRRKQNAA